MDKYYYLIAQLPVLYFGRESALTMEQFLDEAAKWLSLDDFSRLEKVDLQATEINKNDPPIIRQVKDFELELRLELVNWRTAQKKNRDYKIMTFPANLVREGNPLAVEKNLLLWRWQFLEALEIGHHFDLDFLILYYLRLQILKRLFIFDKKLGREKYQQYYEMSL
ncbi:MAG: DUF2764 family protein [Candidatus Marinimicrobia bacterium]|jgi:hypothetical protein|nr:DUF2764 family protein [Candidatus Neomarinimicrobiota bacterium]MCK9484690.1 DUF2764 family protein [Candidatus Neomarinimicrobiota bacterium]MCK9559669.1 DUF2764 family protein [Candidatus Neomarinimicrobiota bacterium]MDD5229786.1 DUF2764 family protein [Candidatus Neomarinimicrobiota bacterium]MDD5539880.1 DUF2764 family protein [Candidatus Neomarinimicrobiota bacterium]